MAVEASLMQLVHEFGLAAMQNAETEVREQIAGFKSTAGETTTTDVEDTDDTEGTDGTEGADDTNSTSATPNIDSTDLVDVQFSLNVYKTVTDLTTNTLATCQNALSSVNGNLNIR